MIELPNEISALFKPPMKIEACNFVGKCMSSPLSYRSSLSSWRSPTMLQIADVADRELASAWEKSRQVHDANAAAIAHNQTMRDLLTAVMKAAGMPEKFSEYGYPKPQSRYQKHFSRDAAWPREIAKTFPTYYC